MLITDLTMRRLSPLDDGFTDSWSGFGQLHAGRRRSSRTPLSAEPKPANGSTDDGTNPPSYSLKNAGELPTPLMRFEQKVFRNVSDYLDGQPPEAAGILFGDQSDESIIKDFVPDQCGRGTAVSFQLNAPFLNRVLKERKALGQTCIGIAHSHPSGVTQPSSGDLTYFRRLFSRPVNHAASSLYVPIFCDGRMYAYVYQDDRIHPAQIVLI